MKKFKLILLSASFITYSHSIFAYDLISQHFSPPSTGGRPILLVGLTQESPHQIADRICKKVGFTKGVKTDGVSIEDTEIKPGQKYIYLGDMAFQDWPTASGGVKVSAFSKLDCDGTPPSLALKHAACIPAAATASQQTDQLAQAVETALLESENKAFDQKKKDPDTLILDLYKQSHILALGEANHANYKIYTHLKTLLEKVGMDPDLKYLAIERSHNLAGFYESISKKSVDDETVFRHLPTLNHKIYTLDGGGFSADPYFITSVAPLIQELNKKREHPLIIIPIDGSQVGERPLPPLPIARDHEGIIPTELTTYSASWDREAETSHLFKERVLNQLGSNGKVIVLYHLGHLAQGIQGHFAKINFKENIWEAAEWHPSSWLGFTLEENPELRQKTKVIAFDEKDSNGSWAPNGTFKFTQRQALRNPNQSFGVEMKDFKDRIKENGLENFSEQTSMRMYFGDVLKSDKPLTEMFDAIIWSHDAHEKYKVDPQLGLKAFSQWLPKRGSW